MRLKRIVNVLLVLSLLTPPTIYSKSTQAKQPKQPAFCSVSGYVCLRVKSGQSWDKLFPDERERGIVMRINRTNSNLYAGKYIKVPENLANSDLLDYSPFPLTLTDGLQEKVIIFDPVAHAWGAYDEAGSLVRWGPATGGNSYCADIGRSCRTKAGEFRIFQLGSSNCKSSKFPLPDGGAPMPFCMFFNGGQAFHGSPGAVIAGNVSHGCVRMFVSDAEWLRYSFVEAPNADNGYRGTKVIVRSYDTPLPDDDDDSDDNDTDDSNY